MKKFLMLYLLFSGFFITAQQNIAKPHYNIINPNAEFDLTYEKALSHTQLDGLRFLTERRIIPIEGTKISIELFSAQELLLTYGKPISPITIQNSINSPAIKFELLKNKYSLAVTSSLPIQNQTSNQKAKISQQTITEFGTTFTDLGGAHGNYANNENYIQTIYSDNGETPYLKFTSFSTENNFDVMYIYDGPDASSKLIGSYSGGNAPTIVKATGAYLTVAFTSDNSNVFGGWSAIVDRGTPVYPSPLSAPNCASADPFCSGTNYNFPATTGSSTGEVGPNYGCVLSQPNPAWYYLQIANTGPLVLGIAGTAGGDVDFVCWGPFTSPTAPCTAGLTGGCSGDHNCSGNIVDCSYSTSPTETCTIPNAVSGQYYMVMITNFSNTTQNITLSQSGGTGSTNCNIVNCGVTASNTGPYCVGQTISLSAATTNTTATTYAWTGPNSFNATGQNVTIPNSTLAMSGTYSVTGTTSGTVTCVATTSVVVNTNTPPVVNSPTICAGGTATLTATPATNTFVWSTGATTASITVTPVTNTVYTVTGTVGTCTASNTATVTVIPNPTVTVNSGSVCGGASATLTATGATNYSWSPLTGLNPTSGGTVTATPASTTVYTVSGTVGTCSATPVTSTVTIFPSATVTATSNSLCVGGSAPISANGAITYTWTPALTLSSSSNPNVTATPTITTTYSVAGTDGNGCVAGAASTVTVYALPTFTVTAPPVCVSQTLTINITPGYANYSIPSIPLSTAASQIQVPNATVSMSGTYNIIVTDLHACNNFGSVQVLVTPSPTITALATPVCMSSTGTLTATGAGTNGTYTWSPATNLNTVNGNEVLISPTSTVNTSYTVIGEDANGCTNAYTLNVAVNALPVVSILPNILKGCLPQCTTTYTATSNPAAMANGYNWNFGSGQTSTAQSPTPCFQTAGNQPIKLTVTDINGCVNTATATAIIYPIPVPDFDYTPKPATILTPEVHFANETFSTAATGYEWNFGDGSSTTDSSNLNNPIYTYLNAGTYYVTLIAMSANGCSDTIVKPVVIEQDYAIYVPNAFSPNGDGKNEIFKAEAQGIFDFTMYVFDRWGNNIFTTTDIEVGWDGRRNNKGSEILQQDVYVWKIELRNLNHQGQSYSGTVSLLR